MDISLVFTKEEREDIADGLDEFLYVLDNQLDGEEYHQNVDSIQEIKAKIKQVSKLHDKVTKGLY